MNTIVFFYRVVKNKLKGSASELILGTRIENKIKCYEVYPLISKENSGSVLTFQHFPVKMAQYRIHFIHAPPVLRG